MANILTAKELGQYLKFSESTIYKLAFDGELPFSGTYLAFYQNEAWHEKLHKTKAKRDKVYHGKKQR